MVRLSFPDKIVTDRLYLTPLKYEDASEIFYAYASKPQATQYVSWRTHRSIEDTYAFLRYSRHAREHHKDYSFAIRTRHGNRLVGSIGVLNSNGEVQFGYIFSPTQWGKGYATEVCNAVLDLLRQQPVVKRIFTYVAPENRASIRVLQKCGLVQETVLKNFLVFPNQKQEAGDCLLFRLPFPA